MDDDKRVMKKLPKCPNCKKRDKVHKTTRTSHAYINGYFFACNECERTFNAGE